MSVGRCMLIYPNLEQGSAEWHRIRLGTPTTSQFSKIITPTGKKSAQFDDYMNELIAELITGEREAIPETYAMARGTELEPEAVSYYEYHQGANAKVIGFITSDCGRIGCSPDRLIGRDGLLEIKCPLQKQHTKNLISETIDSKYIPQVQGQLYMTGRKWCDWMSYFPSLPASIVRAEPDPAFQDALAEYLEEFIEKMDLKIERLKKKGVPFKADV